MMKYVVKNILNTIQYMIKRYIKKVYLLIIMFLLGMIFQSNVFAAEEDNWSPTTPVGAGNITVDTNNFNFIYFNGFQCYYIPVKKSMKVGFYVDATRQFEFRCGFSRDIPSTGSSAYSFRTGTVSQQRYSDYSFQASHDGYFFFSYYPTDAVSLALYTSISTADAVSGLDNTIQQQTQIIQNQTTVIQQQTNAINNQTNTLNNSINNSTEQVVGALTDSTIDDDSMTIDTSSFDTSGDAEVNNFMSSFLNTVYNAYTGITDDVITITIPLPYTDKVLTLESDLLSRYIINTPLYTLIQVFWTFVIGSYLVMFTYRIYAWLSSGKIAERGISGFISYLDEQNELIKTYMM